VIIYVQRDLDRPNELIQRRDLTYLEVNNNKAKPASASPEWWMDLWLKQWVKYITVSNYYADKTDWFIT